jgi:hypothetical protein
MRLNSKSFIGKDVSITTSAGKVFTASVNKTPSKDVFGTLPNGDRVFLGFSDMPFYNVSWIESIEVI